MISVSAKGDFKKTEFFIKKLYNCDFLTKLEIYGQEGVAALSSATPKDSGLASSSWYYTINKTKNSASVTWCNSDVENGALVVLLLQYGHGVKKGAYIQGQDYINPAIKPVFNKMASNIFGG